MVLSHEVLCSKASGSLLVTGTASRPKPNCALRRGGCWYNAVCVQCTTAVPIVVQCVYGWVVSLCI